MSDLSDFMDEFAPGLSKQPLARQCEFRGGLRKQWRCSQRATARVGEHDYCAQHATTPANFYRPATEFEGRRAHWLARASMLPGTNARKFARELRQQLETTGQITEKQAHYLAQLAWKFRRQMPATLVPAVKPEGA